MTIRITRLANGMTVATDTIDHVETVALGVWVGVGARHETVEVNGISHMLEHMAFKGTHRRSARDIAEEIEAVGGHLNAYTSRENTAFYAKVLKEDTALAVDLVADILQNATMDIDELERERQVVLQEIGQANDTPDDIIFDRFQEVACPDQPVGRPVLGRPEVVAAFDRETLCAFMGRHYSPARMVLAAAGNIDHRALVALAEAAFVNLPAHRGVDAEPLRYRGGEYREARELEQVHVVFGLPGIAYGDDAFYDMSVFNTLLGGGMSSRLFQEIREKRGLVYSVYSFNSHYVDGGLFGIYAGTGREEAAELLPAMVAEVKRACDDIDEEELCRARAQLKASVLMGLESTSGRCEQLARQLQVFGRPVPTDEIIAKIDAVSVDSAAAIGRRLIRGAPTLAAIGPVDRLAPLSQVAELL